MGEWTDAQLAADARRELLENILPFWRHHAVDPDHGGFIAQLSNDLRRPDDAPKGLILNARVLWTFSAAYPATRLKQDRDLARRAYDYLTSRFLDPAEGGYYWELTPRGEPLDTRKKVYGQAFCIYALAEYHRVFQEPLALKQAQQLYQLLQSHARDQAHGGYLEVFSRDWKPCDDMRLSDQDMDEKKSMNNHLHLLEAYTGLHRVWPNTPLADRLRELLVLFEKRILNRAQTHLQHFFDEKWASKSDRYTFGHDIEGSWLLCEVAAAIGGQESLSENQAVAVRLARAVLEEGLDADGGLFYEGCAGQITDSHKEWWPQAEAVVGFYNAWQITGDHAFRDAAERCWRFIQDHIVDRQHGEWFWRVSRDHIPDASRPKVSAWKCPYHNGRCCLELIRRTQKPPPSKIAP